MPLLRTHECTVTSSKPLVLRAGLELDSARLGQLQPGQKVKLLELVMVDDGDGKQSARASVALSDDSSERQEPEPPYLHTWRETFTVRPQWLDGVPTPRSSRSAPSSARATRANDRSISPFGPARGTPRSKRSTSPFSQSPFSRPRSPPRLATALPPSPSPPQPEQAKLVPVGWVTVHKGEQELVTPRGHLAAGERQRHLQHWARRLAVDKTVAVQSTQKQKRPDDIPSSKQAFGAPSPTRRKKRDLDLFTTRDGASVYTNELSADPTGIGFAFGGVEPGRLHAHGQVYDTHKVQYSIATCGTYRLHVGLRHDGIELPGSPFLLRVTAGPASALSTKLPMEFIPLSGVVGSDGGCKLRLQTCDKMGNLCTEGGARVTCFCKGDKEVDTDVKDCEDGTYVLF